MVPGVWYRSLDRTGSCYPRRCLSRNQANSQPAGGDPRAAAPRMHACPGLPSPAEAKWSGPFCVSWRTADSTGAPFVQVSLTLVIEELEVDGACTLDRIYK